MMRVSIGALRSLNTNPVVAPGACALPGDVIWGFGINGAFEGGAAPVAIGSLPPTNCGLPSGPMM